jgi:hypothetical protein
MIKLIRYSTKGGSTSLGELETLGRLAAFAVLAGFLSTEKMTACLQPNCRITRIVDARGVLFWCDGDGDGEYAHFEGNARVIAELTAIFRMRNDNEELREALRQRLCSQTLPGRLWASTASSAIGGDTYRKIVLMYMAGVDETSAYTHAADAEDSVEQLVSALAEWLQERDAGRKIALSEILKPLAKAA